MNFSRNTCLSLSFITLSFSFLFSARLIALPKVIDYKINSEFIDSVIQELNIKYTKPKKVIISQPELGVEPIRIRPKARIRVKNNRKFHAIANEEQNTIFLSPKPITEAIQIKNTEEEFPVLRRPTQT